MSTRVETMPILVTSMELVGKILLLFLVLASFAFGEARTNRYALILTGAPAAEQMVSRKELKTAASEDHVHKIESAQQALRSTLRSRKKIATTGAVQVLLNAVFVAAPESREDELRSLPGVQKVVRLYPLKRRLNAALDLMNVPAAWNVIGGPQNAGAGVKIGILDTGIDQSHPGFQDPSLQAPAGFPKCQQQNGDCAFTNNKVIVARSYVKQLNFEFGMDPSATRPDDYSPRDRVGHGTAAAMVAAGVRSTGPLGTITGVAPKAFLGNYKIFGSPGVNDSTYPDVLSMALQDALQDGMDIVNISVGSQSLCAPDLTKDVCGASFVDLQVPQVENAVRLGMTVVVSAGNDGDLGTLSARNSVQSPGIAPSAITVGATTSSHIFNQTVRFANPNGSGNIDALFGNGPKPNGPLTGPLRDVSKVGDDGFACAPLNNASLTGAIALIQRGNCQRDTKINYAQKAGAIGVIIYQSDGLNGIFPMTGLDTTGIPAVLVGNTDGVALKQYAAANPNASVTLDPTFREVQTSNRDSVAFFSSQGPYAYYSSLSPLTGVIEIKPELVATGTDIYTATQTYDPNGELYGPSGFTSASVQGTSFSAPLVAGAAALVKQRNPGFTPAQIKSALVNTANEQVNGFDSNGNPIKASIASVGAGKLDAAAAVQTNVTADPATLSFGIVTATLPARGFTLRNAGSSAVNLTLSIQPRGQSAGAQMTLSNTSVNLAAGQSAQITARLSGNTPQPGSYEGVIAIQGGAVPLHIPYLYVVSDLVPYNVLPILNSTFVGEVGTEIKVGLKVMDFYGAPISGVSVRFSPSQQVIVADQTTDQLGIAVARMTLSKQFGDQTFTGEALVNGNVIGSVQFTGTAQVAPVLRSDGIVNAASQQAGQGFAPGSYITIFGKNLSEATRGSSTPYLPISLAGVSVSFDSGSLSLPGHLSYVSDTQINVQIPWEFQGLSSVAVKVSVGDALSSGVITIPLNDYAPASFEYTDSNSGRVLAAALDENFKLISGANPVARGHVAQLFVNGLGPVDNPVASGEVATAQPLSRTRVQPVVTIAGQPAQVIFSGLAPGNVGLYQVNVIVPANVPAGIQPVGITSNGISSKSTNLPIQ